MTFRVGNDNGNSEHDLIIDGTLIAQPAVFSKISKLPDLSTLNDESFVDDILNNMITTVISGSINGGAAGSYYVGEYATRAGKLLHNIEVGAFNSKLNSDVPLVNTLSVIAAYAVSKAVKMNPEVANIEIDIDMVTALPVTQYSPATSKEFFAKFMDHDHEVQVHLPSRTIDVKLHFVYVKVLPESICSTFYVHALTMDAAENMKSEKDKQEYIALVNNFFRDFNRKYNLNVDGSYFKGLKILHNSIGEGTTEIPLTNDIAFDPNFIEGTNNGVGHAINDVLNTFIREKNLVKFSRQDYSAIIKDPSHKHYNFAMSLIQEPLSEQGEIIFRNTKQEVGKANNAIDVIMVHGGGSILMRDVLIEEYYAFGEKTDIKIFFVPPEFAVFLEVLGMYAFLKSDIFKNLKINYLGKQNNEVRNETTYQMQN